MTEDCCWDDGESSDKRDGWHEAEDFVADGVQIWKVLQDVG
jgi:hypothetical protein